MKNPITSAVLKAATQLEQWAKLQMAVNEPSQPVPSGLKQIATDSPSYFDKLTYVSPEAKTESFISKHGDLLFVITYY